MCTSPEVIATIEPESNTRVYQQRQNSQSKCIGKLIAALAAAQREYKPIKRATENCSYTTETRKAMYAELQDVIAATQPALSAHGLAIIQRVSSDLKRCVAIIETILAHESGQWVANVLELPAIGWDQRWNDETKKKEWYRKFDSQTLGIAFTYGRRYSWLAIAGVSSEPDDDANAISAAQRGSAEAAQAVANEKIATLKQKVGNGLKTASDLEKQLRAGLDLIRHNKACHTCGAEDHHASDCPAPISKVAPDPTRVLFVAQDFVSNTYQISGSAELMKETGWKNFAGLSGDEMADFNYLCEKTGITLKKLRAITTVPSA
jgi:ERF superfamily protein